MTACDDTMVAVPTTDPVPDSEFGQARLLADTEPA